MKTTAVTYNIGWMPIHLWRDDTGQWHYDGPASCGPRHVRTSGRGPAWTGKISAYFARELQKRLRSAGYSPR